jgi:hypothetical protein
MQPPTRFTALTMSDLLTCKQNHCHWKLLGSCNILNCLQLSTHLEEAAPSSEYFIITESYTDSYKASDMQFCLFKSTAHYMCHAVTNTKLTERDVEGIGRSLCWKHRRVMNETNKNLTASLRTEIQPGILTKLSTCDNQHEAVRWNMCLKYGICWSLDRWRTNMKLSFNCHDYWHWNVT